MRAFTRTRWNSYGACEAPAFACHASTRAQIIDYPVLVARIFDSAEMHAVDFTAYVVASIATLFCNSCPPNVSFFVVAIGRNSIQGMFWRRLWANVFVELFERLKAKFNATSTVQRVAFHAWAIASFFGGRIGAVLRRFAHSVLLAVSTPTRKRSSIANAGLVDYLNCSAITDAFAHRSLQVLANHPVYRKHSKSLACHIRSVFRAPAGLSVADQKPGVDYLNAVAAVASAFVDTTPDCLFNCQISKSLPDVNFAELKASYATARFCNASCYVPLLNNFSDPAITNNFHQSSFALLTYFANDSKHVESLTNDQITRYTFRSHLTISPCSLNRRESRSHYQCVRLSSL